MNHLTRLPADESKEVEGYALYVSIPLDEAQTISDALTEELGEESGNKKSAFVRDCIVGGVLEPVAQRRIEHAQEILDTRPSLPITVDDLIGQIVDVRKALRGWPTLRMRKFVSEDSDGYKGWAAKRANNQAIP